MSIGYGVKLDQRITDKEGTDVIVDQYSNATLSAGQAVVPFVVLAPKQARSVFAAHYDDKKSMIRSLMDELTKADMNITMLTNAFLEVIKDMPRSIKVDAICLYPVRDANIFQGKKGVRTPEKNVPGETAPEGRPTIAGFDYDNKTRTDYIAFMSPMEYENPYYHMLVEEVMQTIHGAWLEVSAVKLERERKTMARLGNDELLVQIQKPEFLQLIRQQYIDVTLNALYGEETTMIEKEKASKHGLEGDKDLIRADTILMSLWLDYLRDMLAEQGPYYHAQHKFSKSAGFSVIDLRKFNDIANAMMAAFSNIPTRVTKYPLANKFNVRASSRYWSFYCNLSYYWPEYMAYGMGIAFNGWQFTVAQPIALGDKKRTRFLTGIPQEAARMVTLYDFDVWTEEALESDEFDLYEKLSVAIKHASTARDVGTYDIDKFGIGQVLPLDGELIQPPTLSFIDGDQCIEITNIDAKVGELVVLPSDLEKHALSYTVYGPQPITVFPKTVL